MPLTCGMMGAERTASKRPGKSASMVMVAGCTVTTLTVGAGICRPPPC